MELNDRGLVTGVGSLPYREADLALSVIRDNVPQIPHWPQLPLAGADEGFSVQYLQALIKLGLVKADDKLYFDQDSPNWLERVTEFYTLYLAALEGDDQEKFAFPPEAARGFYAFVQDLKERGTRQALYLKGQLSGPLTVGFQLTGPDKRACYYDPQLRDILVKNLALHAIWQVRTLKQFGLPVIMIVDDPGLYAYGLSTHVTLSREEIIADLNAVYSGIQAQGAAAGAHVCAGMDWTVLFDTQVEIVNFDAYEYFDSMKVYANRLKDFLERGGVLSWGIVPTSQKILDETPESLLSRLDGYLDELAERGVPRSLVLQQSLFTPSCGTGTLSPELALRIYQTLGDMRERLKNL